MRFDARAEKLVIYYVMFAKFDARARALFSCFFVAVNHLLTAGTATALWPFHCRRPSAAPIGLLRHVHREQERSGKLRVRGGHSIRVWDFVRVRVRRHIFRDLGPKVKVEGRYKHALRFAIEYGVPLSAPHKRPSNEGISSWNLYILSAR